jgi:hypothetical protein
MTLARLHATCFPSRIFLSGCDLHRKVEGPGTGDYEILLSVIAPYVQLAGDGKEPVLRPFSDAIAYVIRKSCDSTRANAIARPLNGKPWRGGIKAKNLPGSEAKRPIGLRKASSYEQIALVEGGPDTIAAFHHALVDDVHETLSVICMASANAEFRSEDLEFVAGKRIRIFPHCDKAGFNAALRWCNQLKSTASVTWFDFDGLICTDGKPVGDLNRPCQS